MSEENKYGGVLVFDEDELLFQELLETVSDKKPVVMEASVVERIKPVAAEALVVKQTRVEPKPIKTQGKPSTDKEKQTQVVDLADSEKLSGEEADSDDDLKKNLVSMYGKTSVQQYMADLDKLPRHPKTREEEVALFEEYKRTGNLHPIWIRNLRLVAKYARKYALNYTRLDFLDIVQEGNIGLKKAIERFEPERGNRFSTYATCWIQQAIDRKCISEQHLMRQPVHVRQKIVRYFKAYKALGEELQRTPTLEELAKKIGCGVNAVKVIDEVIHRRMVSADSPICDDEGSSDLIDFIEDTRPLADELMHDQELSDNVIGPAVARLKPRQRFVIVMRFGLDGIIFSEQDIAKAMMIDLSEVRTLELSVLGKLGPPEDILFDQNASTDWMRHVSRMELTPQEELVFILRYGIGAQESTLEKISERVGVTRERIRQIEEVSIPLLRRYMENDILREERKQGIHKMGKNKAVSAAEAMRGA